MTSEQALPLPLELIRVSGSHREVGEQIGEATRDVIRGAAAFDPAEVPEGRSVDEQMALAGEYREVTRRYLPWVVEELDGVAAGAGVDPIVVFAHSIEEIWYEPYGQPVAKGSRGMLPRGRCSDLVAVPPATADGHVLAAHNNDLRPETEADVVAVERTVPGEPRVLSIGIGPWISVGWNSAGLWLGGNELAPNDERVGIPRLLQVRDALTRTTPAEATEAVMHTARASSYNWVFAHPSAGVVNVEGSATAAQITEPDDRGLLAHTNHYVETSMLAFEGDPEYAVRSEARYRQACRLLADGAGRGITTESLREMLSSHDGAPDSVCRHDTDGARSKTVFWCVTDVTEGRIAYGRGNPCRSLAQTYAFED